MSNSVQTQVESLVQGLQNVDPRLHQAILLLNSQLESVNQELFPLTQQSLGVGGGISTIAAPSSFLSQTTLISVRFNWSSVVGAFSYEIRRGNDWNTASFQLRSSGLSADIDPLPVGVYTFLIKSIDNNGNYSANTATTTVNISTIGTITLSGQVIDNNILISWTPPISQFNIVHYEVYRDLVFLGTSTSTFFVRFEAVAGTYIYKVVALDLAGNKSPEATISLKVNTPPDYILEDFTTSDLSGTRVNVIKENSPLALLCCWATESYQDHFTSRFWNSAQNQVDAGYPIYIQPTAPDGSYLEVIDYGSILSSVIVTITYQKELIVSDVNIVVQMRVSNDGSSWSTPTFGASQFFSQLRYLEFKFLFTATS